MDIDDFDYELPAERIAQEPAEPRDAARLLLLRRESGAIDHRRFGELPRLLDPGDLLVLNDTRVVPARLIATKPTGGRVELLLLERVGTGREAVAGAGETWRALVGASRVPRPGDPLELGDGYRAELLERPDAGGCARIALSGPGPSGSLLECRGLPPLPPYIRRAADDPRLARDRTRYQTTFARVPGAIAAPTAGLHFTPALLERLAARGVEHAFVTLHVGEGTFRPLSVARTEEIELHAERFELPRTTAEAISAARRRGGRVVAVGTTVVRSLESSGEAAPRVPRATAGETGLCITPGFEFRFVDALLTNFHLPRTSLLMLVAAFAGLERTLAAYRAAVAEGYRFYSYGDAMLVTP